MIRAKRAEKKCEIMSQIHNKIEKKKDLFIMTPCGYSYLNAILVNKAKKN